MSLNGLDNQNITDAYTSAIAEPGGWYVLRSSHLCAGRTQHVDGRDFLLQIVRHYANCSRLLLKYISRDEIELLGKGTAGFTEARDTIQKYDDEAPLFGLVRYRRRSILIKYTPEGTSRLAQGRIYLPERSLLMLGSSCYCSLSGHIRAVLSSRCSTTYCICYRYQ
jgi:hypothetical protein